MNRYSLLAVVLLFSTLAFSDGRKYELKDINVGLVLSVEGMNAPTQIIKKNPSKSKDEPQWIFQPDVNPIPVKIGDKYKLKVEITNKNGEKLDVGSNKFLHYRVSRSDVFQVNDNGWLTIKPKNIGGENVPPTANYGVGMVWVEYVSDSGEIGLGGFSIDIKP